MLTLSHCGTNAKKHAPAIKAITGEALASDLVGEVSRGTQEQMVERGGGKAQAPR